MSVFTHVFVGTNDLDKARHFYDATLAPLGLKYFGQIGDHGHMYGKEQPAFMIARPRDGKPACFANGGTVGFAAPSREAVRQFHAAGVASGGTDEGEPGPRPIPPSAYAAYLRDPDGNKICAFCFVPG